MKKLSFILAVIMILTSLLAFSACSKDKGGDDNKGIEPGDADIHAMVAAIEEKQPYGDYVSEILYKEDDPDEMIKWTYGFVDINANELLSDYVITMHSDYCNTLAILKFEDGMTEDDFAEVKEVITDEYIESRASSLQMYMPEEYKKMNWALENPDKIWRQYGDDLLVLAIIGSEESTPVWEAIDGYLAGGEAEAE